MIGLGSSAVGIGLAIRLRDHFTAKAAAVSQSMDTMSDKARRLKERTARDLRTVGLGLFAVGVAGMWGFTKSAKAAAEFGWTMTTVRAITGQSAKDMEVLGEKAIELSKKYIFTANEISSAMEYLARAGFTGGEIERTIQAVTSLGAATDTSIGGKGGAADMMTNLMTAFQMTADQSQYMADVLTKTTTRANLEITDLHESMKYLGSVAVDLKIPFEEVASTVAVLANAGIRGGIAGRGMANAFRYMARAMGQFASKKQIDTMQRLGIHPDMLKEANGQLKPLSKVFGLYMNALKSVSGPEKVAFLQALFNIRGANTFAALIRQVNMGRDFNEMMEELRMNARGAADAISEMKMATPKGRWLIFLDTLRAMMIRIGDSVLEVVTPLLIAITKVISGLEVFFRTGLGKLLVKVTLGFMIITTLAGGFLMVLGSIKLITIASTVLYNTFFKSLVVGWNRAAAAAATYAATASGASFISPTGKVFGMKGKKGFISTSTAAKGGLLQGMWGILSGLFGKFFKPLAKIAPGLVNSLATFGKLLAKALGPVAVIVTVIDMFIGFKNVLKMGTYVFIKFAHMIAFVIEFLLKLIKNPTPWGAINAWTAAAANYAERDIKAKEALLGLTAGQGRMNQLTGLPGRGKGKWSGTYTMGGEEVSGSMYQKQLDSLQLNSQVNMDGKRVGTIIQESDSLQNQKVLNSLLAN